MWARHHCTWLNVHILISKSHWKLLMNLLVVNPRRSQCLLELGEAHDVDVDELNHLITLRWATGLVPHNLAHDPEEKVLNLKFTNYHSASLSLKRFMVGLYLEEPSTGIKQIPQQLHLLAPSNNFKQMQRCCCYSSVKEKVINRGCCDFWIVQKQCCDKQQAGIKHCIWP